MNTSTKLMPTREEKLVGKIFNNKLWRQLLNQTCHNVDIGKFGFDIISPFGFELLDDLKFLAQPLRRFYAYIGIPKHLDIDKDKIATNFRMALFENLTEIHTRMLKDTVIIFENNNVIKLKGDEYTCKRTDKLLDIQIRSVDVDILTDYANYTITILAGLYHQTGEGKEFKTNKRDRWRLYQLYIIQEQIFGHLLPSLSVDELHEYRGIFKILSNMIQIFYSPQMIESKPTLQEYSIINNLIKPRITKMYEAVTSNNISKITIKSHAYHHDDILELTLDQDVYNRVFNKIKNTYLNFE